MTIISSNLFTLKSRIHECEKLFQRQPNSVSLLAVSKGQSIEKMIQAIEAGQFAFGENYLQEALIKITQLENQKNLEWHFIGAIQQNKTKKIAEYFHWVHTIDDMSIAKRLNDQRPSHLPPLNICIQVNVSQEQTKNGVNFDNTLPLLDYCLTLPRLKFRGLMTIPAFKNHIIEQRAEFYKLRLLCDFLRNEKIMIDTLSMGMSHDWEAAIAEGSTLLRIGTSIFGARN